MFGKANGGTKPWARRPGWELYSDANKGTISLANRITF